VPAAGRQALEEGVLGGFGVEVKDLRIELPGIGNDLGFVQQVLTADKGLAHVQIVQVQVLFRHVASLW
jgi:hypothetical protein